MSSDKFKLYKSLGSLIKDYRKWHGVSQEFLAESIGISDRELRRWEADRRPARIDNLHDFSEIPGIPMQVCTALNANQPIWYSLQERWFAYSSIEEVRFINFISDELFKCPRSDEAILTINNPITTDKHISAVLSAHCEIYGTGRPLGRDVIKTACMILPDLNRIIFDWWGHYVGHGVCLPIKKEAYEQLKKEKDFEGYLTTERISDIMALDGGVFYTYSMFAASANAAQSIIVDSVRYLARIEHKERYLLASHVATRKINEECRDLGMKTVFRTEFSKTAAYEHMHTENVAAIYEIKLDTLMRRVRSLCNLFGKIEKYESKAGAQNPVGEGKREG